MIFVEYIGIMTSAIAGAMIAMEKKADVFGVLFLAIITAFGGGILRDVMLGIVPHFFSVQWEILVACVAALLVFFDACIRRDHYRENKKRADHVLNFVDSLAIASYTVVGMNIACESGDTENAFLVIALGVTTGIGGGMIRDVLVNTMPFVLRKRIYAVACIAGGILYYYLPRLGVSQLVSAVVAMGAVIALRVLATLFHWNLPHADI